MIHFDSEKALEDLFPEAKEADEEEDAAEEREQDEEFLEAE